MPPLALAGCVGAGDGGPDPARDYASYCAACHGPRGIEGPAARLAGSDGWMGWDDPLRLLRGVRLAAELDSLLVTSGELLQRLLELVPDHQRPWLFDRLLVVPSPRVAEMASAAGFIHITIAQGASNQALVAALELRKME